MNIVGQTGNLTRDPELRFLPDGTPVASIRIATSGAGPRGGAGFFIVEEFGASGRAAAEHLKKGSLVEVSGRLRWSEWTDSETGRHVERVWIRGHIGFLGRRPDVASEDGPAELPPPSDPYNNAVTDAQQLVDEAPQPALLAGSPPASALVHSDDDIPF